MKTTYVSCVEHVVPTSETEGKRRVHSAAVGRCDTLQRPHVQTSACSDWHALGRETGEGEARAASTRVRPPASHRTRSEGHDVEESGA